jgi:hypothetical protein
MDIYKYNKLTNGDILLEKLSLDINNFSTTVLENGDILLTKIISVNISDIANLKDYNFTNSTILSCSINNANNIKLNIKLKYRPILNYIYELINDGVKIIKQTKLNIKTIPKHDEGFSYLENLGISIQGVDTNKRLYEIVNQVFKNEISLKMQIKLYDKSICNLTF